MLILSRKKDDKIIIGNDIEVWVVDIKGDQVKIGINAPRQIKVYRFEVYEEIQAANRAAAASSLNSATQILSVLKKEKE